MSYRERVEVLEAARGSIYDRNLNVISSSVQSYNIGIRPNEVSEKEELSEVLSLFLDMEENKILSGLDNYLENGERANRGVELDGDVADSNQAIILDQVLNGVAIRMSVLFLLLGGKE